MRIKSVQVKYGLNQGIKVPRKIFTNEELRKEHNRFFGNLGQGVNTDQTQRIGVILEHIFDNGMNEYNLKIADYFIKRLMSSIPLLGEHVEFANVFYSTIIKLITPEDILEGRVTPNKYRCLISDSIKNYYNNPVGKEVDYRHIAGRMLNLRMLSEKIPNSLSGFNKKFECIKWTEDNQADLLGVLERILQFYDSSADSFKQTIGYVKSLKQNIVKTSYEEHQYYFYKNIPNLLKLTLGTVRTLIAKNPKRYKEQIEDKLDIAYYYFDKLPYDYPEMNSIMPIYTKLKEQENFLKNY